METPNKRIDWISMAKGFGILGIVAVHSIQRFFLAGKFGSKISSIAFAGMYCVQLFFIISGYLTFKSLDKNTGGGRVKYLVHKVIRFIPVLYTTCLCQFLIYALQIQEIPPITDSIYKKLFFAVTFLNGFSIDYINPWFNWYVGTLIIFIFLAPILYKFINSSKKAVLLFIITTIISWLGDIVLTKCGIKQGDYFYCWFPRQFPVMSLGIVFFYFEKDFNKKSIPLKNSIFTLFFFIFTCFLIREFFFTTPMEIHVRYGFLLLCFSYILFNSFGKYFNWLKILGDNSYGIYLFHGCLLHLFDYILVKFKMPKDSIFIFFTFYILLLLLSLLVSVIFNKFIEKPFLKYADRIIQ